MSAYSLNVFIDSSTTDDPQTPSPTPPPTFGAGLPWRKAYRWEWLLQQASQGSWYVSGDRVLRLPATLPGQQQSLGPLGGSYLSLGLFDINNPLNAKPSPTAVNTLVVAFRFTYANSLNWDATQPFFSGVSSDNLPQTSPTQTTLTNDGTNTTVMVTVTVVQQNGNAFTTQDVRPIPPYDGTTTPVQYMSVWGLLLQFSQNLPSSFHCDATVWAGVTVNTSPLYFYKDPEMEMGNVG